MIYFIANSDQTRIKIGTTIRLPQRLYQLAREYGEGLEVLAVVDGGLGEEQSLHRRFQHLRIVNEWFEPGDDLTGFIVSVCKPWDKSWDEPVSGRRTVLTIKGSEDWRTWLAGLADHERAGIPDVIDRALAKYAKEVGYAPPPPKR